MRGLAVLQFWSGDAKRAANLARFLADIEPKKRSDVDFMFAARFDADHDKEAIEYAARKFNVKTFTARSRATGHPWGCWILWFSVLEHVFTSRMSYDWILTFEADCVPLSANWLSEISSEFAASGANIFGSEVVYDKNPHHINGNMIVSGKPDTLNWLVRGITSSGVPPKIGWDVWLAPQFLTVGAAHSRTMVSCTPKATATREDFLSWKDKGIKFVHGVKDNSLFNLARAELLPR